MNPALVKIGIDVVARVVAAVHRRRARKRAERERLGIPSRRERRMVAKVIAFVLRLGIIPKGWLTYLSGFAAFVLGLACVLGVDGALALPCPEDPMALMLGGAAVIGLRRAVEKVFGGGTPAPTA